MFVIKLRLAIISLVLLMALISDLRSYKIRNSITYGFMVVGLTANILLEGFKGILFSVHGIFLPALCLIVLYMVKMVGAGDVKLFSAVGAVMGAHFTLHAIACSFICGGVIASLLMLTRQNGMKRLKYLVTYVKCCFIAMKPIQYTDFTDIRDDSKFHFSIAAASGTAAAFLLNTPML